MKQARYRARQFWHALTSRPDPQDLQAVRELLSPSLFLLFSRLQPSEQAHAIEVFRKTGRVDPHPDLAVAALLHDVGKIMYPLNLWQRVRIVLDGNRQNGQDANGRKPTHRLVAERHPAWGADLAIKAGASPLAAALIRRHQETVQSGSRSLEDRLLAVLQAADRTS